MIAFSGAKSHSEGGPVFRNASWLALATVIQTLSGLALFAVAGRSLGPSFLGAYAFSLAFSWITSVAVDLGFPQLIVRDVSGSAALRDDYLTNITAAKCVLGALCALVLYPVALALMDSGQRLFLELNLAIILGSFASMRFMFLRACLNTKAEAVSNSLASLLSVAVLLLLVYSGEVTPRAIPAVIALRETIRVVFAVLAYRRLTGTGIRLDTLSARRTLQLARQSLPFAANSLLNAADTQMDILLLGVLHSGVAVGLYSAAIRLLNPVRMLAHNYSQAALPFLSQQRTTDQAGYMRYFRQHLRSIVGASVIAGVGLLVAAPILIEGLFGTGFGRSVALLRVSAFSVPFLSMQPLVVCGLFAVGQERIVGRVRAASTVIGFLAAVPLILVFADYGAATAMFGFRPLQAMWLYRQHKQAQAEGS